MLNKNISISILRIFSMLLIFICHIVQEHSNPYVNITAQFFNVGVPIFIIISGYLYGSYNFTISSKNWYAKRFKRIFIPLYSFLFFLFIIYIILGIKIEVFNWIIYILNLQAIQIYIGGAEHLWFLTIIMFCYLITPFLNKFRTKFPTLNYLVFFTSLICIQILATYYINKQFGIYLIYINLYISSYLFGMLQKITLNKRSFITSTILSIFIILLRLLGKFTLDSTIFYDVIFVGYTQSVLALWIFYVFLYLFKNLSDSQLITFLDPISFEFYLTHYMFIKFPLSVMNTTSSFLLNSLIALVFTLLSAILLNKINNLILKLAIIKKQHIQAP